MARKWILWISLFALCASAGELDLRQAEWRREVDALAVMSAESDQKALATALGRTRDDRALAPLVALTGSSDPSVQLAALAALAWIPGGEVPLREFLDQTPARGSWGAPSAQQRARANAYWALGHHGKAEDVARLASGLGEAGPAAEAAARGLGRMGRDGVDAARSAVPALLMAAGSPRRPLEASASYALGRIGCPAEQVEHAADLARQASQATARGYLLRSVRESAGSTLREALLVELRSDPESFPRVEALGLARGGVPVEVVKAYLDDPDVSVRVAAVSALGRLDGEVAPLLAQLAASGNAWVAREAAAQLVALGRSLPDTPALSEAQRVAILVEVNSLDSNLQIALEDSRPEVRSSACGQLLGAEDGDLGGLGPSDLAPLLDSEDAVVRACGVQVLGLRGPGEKMARLLEVAIEDEDSDVRYEALKLAVNNGDLERLNRGSLERAAQRAAATAEARFRPLLATLTEILGAEMPAIGPADAGPSLYAARLMRSAVVFTNRGSFRIELDARTAPYAVWNFVRLAEQDFFDGVAFHRVVPGFVVQTGCPRGDGWGGPGYAIPDEVSAEPYGPGVVGMARSDRDTAGSQWFITVSNQPHLVGDYTAFGKVTRGLDVVKSMEWSDRIVDVRIERVKGDE